MSDHRDYIERILRAKVYDVAIESPLETASRLSRRLDNRIELKREDLQPVFSFKLRGAYNKIATLSSQVASRGVICASAGNHAQGVALAASRRGIPSVIVMPVTTPQIKVSAVRDLGAKSFFTVTITILLTSMRWAWLAIETLFLCILSMIRM